MKKKISAETWNGLLPILVLSYDTMHCIVIGRAGRLAWAQPRGHDTAGLARSKAYDMARQFAIRRAVRAAGSKVTIQRIVSWLRRGDVGLATQRRSCDTIERALQHCQAKPTTRRRVRAIWAKVGCTVHSTQCTIFSHCLGHCS